MLLAALWLMRKILVYLVGSKMEDICAPLQAEHDTHKFPWVKVFK
jgi:hypothetical protein